MPTDVRRRLGAHYTPVGLAQRLVRLAFDHAPGADDPDRPLRVCDPSCGAGSILLAAADELVQRGATPAAVLVTHLVGCDIDPGAVEAARGALIEWARTAGEPRPPEPRILEADALALPEDFPPVDVVVGNPPFASPLSADVAQRRAAGLHIDVASDGAYVDEAALHLRAAVELVAPGGVVCLLAPQSILGSRDAAAVRAAVSSAAVLEALWASGEDLFEEASVRVCAPVLVCRDAPVDMQAQSPASVVVHWQDEARVAVSLEVGDSWSPLLARAMGTPQIGELGSAGHPESTRHRQDLVTVGDLARCTAGFREEFYALTAAAFESAGEDPAGSRADSAQTGYRLVTSGMIDPGVLSWGTGNWRLAGTRFTGPLVDPARLDRDSSRVARWAAARLVAKVMVSSQTKVLEAVADDRGDCVPVTPVVSVEPTGGCTPRALAAMMSAPSNSARLATATAGTGLSASALRVSGASVAALVVSSDPTSWLDAGTLWTRLEELAGSCAGPDEWWALGAELDRLLGIDAQEEVLSWWVARLPRRVVDLAHLT